MKLASFAAAGLLCVARPALALPRVAIDRGACAQLDQAEVDRLLSVELVNVANVVSAGGLTAATQVRLRCEPPDSANVLIQVDDQLTNKVVHRRVDLGRVSSEAHGRVLAIAVAELIRASWLELPARPSPPPEVRASPPRAPRGTGFALGMGPEIMAFGGKSVVLAGGSLIGSAELMPRFPIETGISFVVASQNLPGGSANLQLGTLHISSGWAFASGKLKVTGFGGGRAGWFRGQGTPDDANQTLGHGLLLPWAGVVAGVDARLPLGLPFLGLRVQGGYTLLGVRGKVDAERGVDLAGGFGIASLLLGVSL